MTGSAEGFIASFKRFFKIENDFVAEFEGQTYHFQGKVSSEKFAEWFSNYASGASRCVSCQKIIFPGETVGRESEGLVHLNMSCCTSGGFFVGKIGKDGKLIPAFPEGETAASHCLKSGGSIFIQGLNTSHPVIEENEKK